MPTFTIERSADGVTFTSIGTAVARTGCDQGFDFKDKSPLPGNNYYRIKISDNGTVHYTSTILLQADRALITTLYPNAIKKGQSIQVAFAESDGVLQVTDAAGRQVYNRNLTLGVQSFLLPVQVSGVYFYSIQNSKGIHASGKIVVQ